MTFVCPRWAALAIVPALAIAEAPASAEPLPSPVTLPRGVHLADSGRYYHDVCDHAYAHPCLSMRLLPETYRPEAGNAGGAGNYCSCGTMSPCGGGGTADALPRAR